MALKDLTYEDYNKVSPYPLKEEQLEGIKFALEHQNCIMSLGVGCGKTMASLVVANLIMRSYSDTMTFIICPKIANTSWQKELKAMGVKYSIITTDEREIDNRGRFFIFNYSRTEEMKNLLCNLHDRNIRVIGIFDEIHLLGDGTSGLGKEFQAISELFTIRLGLTGTPLCNNFMGLYNVVNFVRPGFLGPAWKYRQDWLIIKKKQIYVQGGHGRKRMVEEVQGYRDLPALGERLKGVIIVRNKKYPLHFYTRTCTLTESEWEYYRQAGLGILEDYERDQVTGRLYDLQKVADGCAGSMATDTTYSKKRLLISLCQEVVSRNEGLIIYTELEDTYNSIGDTLKKYHGAIGYSQLYYITGKTKEEDRQYAIKHLKRKDIIVITKAGCRSCNLQALNNICFYDTPFSIEAYIQAIGRISRTDSEYDAMNVYTLEVMDTIDSYKRILAQSHMNIIQEIFGRSTSMQYYGDLDKDIGLKYRDWLKKQLLWMKGKK